MARRSSARLRGRNSSTPKRVSLSHDAQPTRTPKTVPTKLGSLDENDEMPGAFPSSPKEDGTPTRAAKRVARGIEATPKNTTPIKPSDEEMHPQKHHQTATKPLDEARHLGFLNMGAYTAPPKQQQGSRIPAMQATPTRTQRNPAEDANKEPTYQFTFRREHSLELSPEAKKLMVEKREEAARIRKELMASGEGLHGVNGGNTDGNAKKKATPKGRFSDAHKEAFGRMQSIAGHASAFRADPNRSKAAEKEGKSLKRSPSKAQLDDPDPASKRTLHRSPSKPTLTQASSHLPRATSTHNFKAEADDLSPTKRQKRSEADDVSGTRLQNSSDDDEKPLPSTPQQLRIHPSNPHRSTMTTPTQASLARAASVKSAKTGSKIPAPNLARSPSKPNLMEKKAEDGPSTPLLARSPSKGALLAKPATAITDGCAPASPLLARSPSKAAIFGKPTALATEDGAPANPLLSRSPFKLSTLSKKPTDSSNSDQTDPRNSPKQQPLLARSPFKMSIAKNKDREAQVDEQPKQPTIPLLARSPSKIALPSNPTTSQTTTLGKPTTSGFGLMSRFNLLRSSPMKSILRSPQRLYSDDPAKVAAGTHLATPPKFNSMSSQTASVQKRVDFSNSTKARYEASQSPSTPSKDKILMGDGGAEVSSAKGMDVDDPVDYPNLPSPTVFASPSPQKRRQTVAPGDFTFRADSESITFGQSPNAPAGGSKRPSIRAVSAEPEVAIARQGDLPLPQTTSQGSKKRKFEFENDDAVTSTISDKENNVPVDNVIAIDEVRPAKRIKPSTTPDLNKLSQPTAASRAKSVEPTTTSPTKRRQTLGVKPREAVGGKKGKAVGGGGGREREKKVGGVISKERLNALATPKKRV